MSDEILKVTDLSVTYPGSNDQAISNVNFSLMKGTITMIVGPNGSGKTTLIKSLLGLIDFNGSVEVMGKSLKDKITDISYVTQRFEFDRTFPITVYELISLFMFNGKGFFDNRNRTVISNVLEKLGIKQLMDLPLASLSGGQLQRVLLARALSSNPKLLILDEPEAGVDVGAEQTFYNLIVDLVKKDGLTVLVSSHDLDVVYTYADTVICLNKKMVCHGSPHTVLNQDTFGKLYGMNLKYYTHEHRSNDEHEHH